MGSGNCSCSMTGLADVGSISGGYALTITTDGAAPASRSGSGSVTGRAGLRLGDHRNHLGCSEHHGHQQRQR